MSSVRRNAPKPLAVTIVATVVAAGLATPGPAVAAVPFDVQSLDGRGNNVANQNVFSERQLTAWGWTWGQFLDHTFGLRLGAEPGEPTGETTNIGFNSADPMEDFTNDLGVIPFVRSAPAPGTGVTNPRQQINSNNSYIDAWTVYGGTPTRLDWLREGSVDGNPANNNAGC
ncbi:peroxidase family protein [Actinoplanes sp. CA-142083]|uniref:peroxidase family protein n=1 Tax=Actinoplanes sp. CA-142083 TaxID=3239903 RepID=UPI003D8D5BB4